MSRMPKSSNGRRPRRQFDEELKAQAVRLVLQHGKSVGAVARDLDLTESALRQWVERTRADQTGGRTGLTTADARSSRSSAKRIASCERSATFKKDAAFFAKHQA
jgi:transposase